MPTKIRDNRTVTYDLAPQVIVPTRAAAGPGQSVAAGDAAVSGAPAGVRAAMPTGPVVGRRSGQLLPPTVRRRRQSSQLRRAAVSAAANGCRCSAAGNAGAASRRSVAAASESQPLSLIASLRRRVDCKLPTANARYHLTTLGIQAAGDDAARLAGNFVHEHPGVVRRPAAAASVSSLTCTTTWFALHIRRFTFS